MGKYEYDTNLNNDIPFETNPNVTNKKEPNRFGSGIIVLVIIGILGYLISTNKNTSINSSNNGSSDSSIVESGNDTYICSKYNISKLKDLTPSSILKNEIDDLENKQNKLERELDSIDPDSNPYLYNSKVDEYNDIVSKLKVKLSNYNQQVDNYNDYLIKNCNKK